MKKKVKKSNLSNITQKWVDLLIPYSNDYSSKFSANELSRKSKIPQQTASRYLNKLVKFTLKEESDVKKFILKCKTVLNNLNSEKIEQIRAKIKELAKTRKC